MNLSSVKTMCLVLVLLLGPAGAARAAGPESLAGEAAGKDLHKPPKDARRDGAPAVGLQAGTTAEGEFTTWERTNQPGKYLEQIAALCGKKNSDPWCGKYAGVTATKFDLVTILRTRGLTLAFYLGAREPLLEALRELVKLAKGPLDGMATSLNSGASVLSPLPGLDLEPLLARALEGLALALKKRAEQEGAAVVLERVRSAVCQGEATPFLPRTCRAASLGAFDGTISAGGLAALKVLQQALIDDMRHFSGAIARKMLERATAAPVKDMAVPVQHMLDGLVDGVRPTRALEGLALALDDRTDDQPRLVACVSSLPAAAVRYLSQVELATGGLAMDALTKGVAVTALAAMQSPCDWALTAGRDDAPIEARLQTLAKLAPQLQHAGQAFVELAQDLRLLASTSEELRKALAGGDTGPAEALGLLVSEIDVVITLADRAVPFVQAIRPDLAAVTSGLRPNLTLARDLALVVQRAFAGDLGAVWSGLLTHTCDATPVGPCAKVPSGVVKYGGLLVAIATAKTSDDVSNALLAAAAPADSWKAKYRSDTVPSATLGGFLGAGMSQFRTPPAGFDRRRGRVIGAVGLDLVLVNSEWFNAGLFLQLLDVGAYLQAGDKGVAKPRLLQAVTPGGAIRLGMFGLPLALLGGAAYDLDAGYPLQMNKPSQGVRYFASLAIDVPLFILKD
jgi:hypothetical protein